jgi:alanine racemase
MPILILGHTPKEQVGRLIEYDVTQAITCKAKAEEYSAEAVRCGGNLKVHIKVDTGMSRLGYLCDNTNFETGVNGIAEACQMPGLYAEGIFTHFAVADEFGEECDAYTKHQFELFTKVIKAVEDRLDHKFSIRHCANTGATARFPETYLDMVRPGLLLYGYGEFARQMGLKPAMSLKTTVSTIKIYPKGTAISYGGTFVTEGTTRIGVLPYGYADGFFRSLSNKCSLYTKEGPAKLRGKICMDMCMIDITDMPTVDVGSEVEIFGEKNSIDELAECAGTIPYELTCAVSKRVPRVYYKNGEVVERELMLRM